MNLDGITSCARYAFMPNRLQYCGPDKNSDLFEYGVREITDMGLADILKKFQTLYPYLKFIAHSNKIEDVFDKRVVEAYWIGNNLLHNVDLSKFYEHLLEDHSLKKKLDIKSKDILTDKIYRGVKPHHSFHVFHIYKRTGNTETLHTLNTMNECRISWGQVQEVFPDKLIVQYNPLIIKNEKVDLGSLVNREVFYNLNDKGFLKPPALDDWVSIHWGWVCEKLTLRQKNNLEFWTNHHLGLLSKTYLN